MLGGQRRVIQLMRIVEHSDINPRGIIVIEEFSANILSRVKMNADYHQVFALHLTTNNASSIVGGEGSASASLIQPPPAISAFSARLNPATFTVPIMSLIRQSSYKTSLWNMIYHRDVHSLIRCGFLQYDNHSTQRPRRPTKLHIAKQLTQSQSAHGGSTSSSIASDPTSSARVTLFHSIEGKKHLLTSLSLKARYMMMIVEHQWKLLKGISRFQAVIRGRKVRRRMRRGKY